MFHKNKMLFFKASCTLCNLKTDNQYDTKRELYSHEFIYVTQALLNKVANVQRFLCANNGFYAQTKQNYEMYALKF